MQLFSHRHGQLRPVIEVAFLEKKLQNVIEANLTRIFGLQYVSSEFSVENLRIDTLAFDPETKSFVLLEYKRNKNFSLVDQGVAYLSLLVNRKGEFLVEYNENRKDMLKRKDVEWSQSRVIFVAPFFTKYQKQAIKFRDFPIELWEVKKFKGNLYSFDRLESPDEVEPITTVAGKSRIVKVTKKLRGFTEQDLLRGKPYEISNLYFELKDRILALGTDVRPNPRKYFVFFAALTNFARIEIQKSKIKVNLYLQPGELTDTKGIARDISQVGHWGEGANFEISVKSSEEVTDVLVLLKQAYDRHRS